MAVPPLSRRWITVSLIALVALLVLYFRPPTKPLTVPFATSFSDTKTEEIASTPPVPEILPPPANSKFEGIDSERPPAGSKRPTGNSKPPVVDSRPPPAADLNPPILNPKPPSVDSKLNTPPNNVKWRTFHQHNPVTSFTPLPTGAPEPRPKIQATFEPNEPAEDRKTRQARLEEIQAAFKHAWQGYRRYAWAHDELAPLSMGSFDVLGGWGATLVDSLDTLWILGMFKEFDEAVQVVKRIDFSTSSVQLINIFETTIRYLGGLLSAYDLSEEKILLDKAVELGEMLYCSFDTPNRIPNTRWDWAAALSGQPIEAGRTVVSAEIGSLTMEFTRLTQLTGDPKYYDAIARITEIFAQQQDTTNLPGLWPVFLNPAFDDLKSGNAFSLGAMADSLYEYLPKQWALLGGREDIYRNMYAKAMKAAKSSLFYKPLNPWKPGELLASGDRTSDDGGNGVFEPKMQHLSCFLGGMVALGSKLFEEPEDMEVARQLTDGCIWAYNSTATGIAPEIFAHVACDRTNPKDNCAWSENRWFAALAGTASTGQIRYSRGKGSVVEYPETPSTSSLVEGSRLAENFVIPKGFHAIPDRKYQLRPEALESVFILYRTTGDKELREHGWSMFESILRTTRVEQGFAGTEDVTDLYGERRDRMESFWTAETLKYAWLLFADEDTVSLDDWVFNTEAHPFKLEKTGSAWQPGEVGKIGKGSGPGGGSGSGSGSGGSRAGSKVGGGSGTGGSGSRVGELEKIRASTKANGGGGGGGLSGLGEG